MEKNTDLHSISCEFDDNLALINLFGQHNQNLLLIEKINNVSINQKGNKIKITGSKNSINDTHYILINLYESIKKGEEVDEEKIKDMKSVISLNFNHEKVPLF